MSLPLPVRPVVILSAAEESKASIWLADAILDSSTPLRSARNDRCGVRSARNDGLGRRNEGSDGARSVRAEPVEARTDAVASARAVAVPYPPPPRMSVLTPPDSPGPRGA